MATRVPALIQLSDPRVAAQLVITKSDHLRLRQVNITLDDANDNTPTFGSDDYYAVIAQTMPVQASIVQLNADDNDIGLNAKLVYYKISGDPDGTFRHLRVQAS